MSSPPLSQFFPLGYSPYACNESRSCTGCGPRVYSPHDQDYDAHRELQSSPNRHDNTNQKIMDHADEMAVALKRLEDEGSDSLQKHINERVVFYGLAAVLIIVTLASIFYARSPSN